MTVANAVRLWIDDLRDPGEGWVWVKNNTQAISYLATWSDMVEEVSIDHDICHFREVGIGQFKVACDETFQATARYIAAVKPANLKRIVLHSGNPDGRAAIAAILRPLGVPIEG